MNILLEKAFHKAVTLSEKDQGQIANALLSMMEGMDVSDETKDSEWDRLVSSSASLGMLDRMAKEALDTRDQDKTTPLNFKNRPRAF